MLAAYSVALQEQKEGSWKMLVLFFRSYFYCCTWYELLRIVCIQ